MVSPVGQGNDGGAMNLNADVAAAALAGAMRAGQLVFLSDVPGLMRDPKDPGTLIREIRVGELEKLEKDGVIGGGMIPKCRSAAAALRQGLRKVEFVDGREAGHLTKVVKGPGGMALRQFKLKLKLKFKRGCRLQATGYRDAPSPICQIPSTFFRKAKMDRIQMRFWRSNLVLRT